MTNSIQSFVHAPHYCQEQEYISWNASELLENPQETFPLYFMHNEKFSIFRFPVAQKCVAPSWMGYI